MGLYRFNWNCGRQGRLVGLFLATAKEVAGLLGKDVNFGNALGKHSEVCGTIEEGEVNLLTEDEEFIEKAKSIGLIPLGYDPLEHVQEGN